jgi:hypothetical protein
MMNESVKRGDYGMDFNKFFIFRYLALIAVISSLVGSTLMFIVGAYKTYIAFGYFFQGVSSSLKNTLCHRFFILPYYKYSCQFLRLRSESEQISYGCL